MRGEVYEGSIEVVLLSLRIVEVAEKRNDVWHARTRSFFSQVGQIPSIGFLGRTNFCC